MTRLLSVLLWTAVFLLLLIGIDQLLVRVPASHPAHVAVATFYRELRSRALDLARGVKAAPAPAPAKPVPPVGDKGLPASIEAIIEQHQEKPAAAIQPATPAPVKSAVKLPADQEPAPRYVYADDHGALHFAGTLAEVPEQYRAKARRLGE